ncbi:sensor histidine kinase [Actinospica robiniae]|uniref:sensor histidine kinase n=1 Tax=Actinospica robiniae TaxID=304901 RepID=UPI000684A8E8|nr:HAMP domain-containing sensor histidine kinase [Actinospica robiniae]
MLTSIVTVTACAVVVFTLPLAWAVAEVYSRGAVVLLQRDAILVSADIAARPTSDPDALIGSDDPSRGVEVGLYSASGRKLAGVGPGRSPVSELSVDGRMHHGIETGHLAVVAPVIRSGRVVEIVRVWMPWDRVTDRRIRAWLVLAVLGSGVVVLSAGLAWHLARRVAAPLEELTAVARALGEGDFTVQAPRTHIREADLAGQALAATARRLGDVLERERGFSTAVSHQLRTPLTALVLGLEAAQNADEAARRAAVGTALRRAESLAVSVEELLRLARETHRSGLAVDAADVARNVANRHEAAVSDAHRRLTVRCESGLAPVRASEAAIAQIIGALLDNALVHGRGEIRLTVTDVGTGVAIEVGDDGPGVAPGGAADEPPVFERGAPATRHGIGLPLARSLAEAEGGRLVMRRRGPRPVFSLLLPVQDREEYEYPPEVSAGGGVGCSQR